MQPYLCSTINNSPTNYQLLRRLIKLISFYYWHTLLVAGPVMSCNRCRLHSCIYINIYYNFFFCTEAILLFLCHFLPYRLFLFHLSISMSLSVLLIDVSEILAHRCNDLCQVIKCSAFSFLLFLSAIWPFERMIMCIDLLRRCHKHIMHCNLKHFHAKIPFVTIEYIE